MRDMDLEEDLIAEGFDGGTKLGDDPQYASETEMNPILGVI